MIALYLLAAHLVGDFLLQNRWQAVGKLTDRWLRVQHVIGYLIPFCGLVAYVHPALWRAAAFLGALAVVHYLTDSRRFYSTLGDVIQWRLDHLTDPVALKREWLEYVVGRAESAGLRAVDVSDEAVKWPTPNPWPATPLMIDQTLHIVQLAILGGLLL